MKDVNVIMVNGYVTIVVSGCDDQDHNEVQELKSAHDAALSIMMMIMLVL